jgi:hypothetical protein
VTSACPALQTLTRTFRSSVSHASIGRQPPMEQSETQIVIDDLNQGKHALGSAVRNRPI